MADVKPFRAIRPRNGLEDRIAALPYDVYDRDEAKREVVREPLSFLKIDRAETQFPDDVDIYADCVYEKAHDLLWGMVECGDFTEEAQDCYYVYELVMDGRPQVGIVACASVDDYLNRVIKKHENTREDKEIDRIRHVDACQAQTGPIFLAYRSRPDINEEVEAARKEAPLYDFCSPDGVIHRVWRIMDGAAVGRIRRAFAEVGEIYIADGHHRCASAVKVSQKRREAAPGYTGGEEFNYFLSVLFPDEQLMIMDYNRVVRDLNGLDEGEFLRRIGGDFQVEHMGKEPCRPGRKGTFGMYLGDSWYRLTVKEDAAGPRDTTADGRDAVPCAPNPVETWGFVMDDRDAAPYYPPNPVESLDVTVLQERLLAPVLGIRDPKTDKRIDFVGGIRGLKELERRVHTDCKVAFAMFPTSIGELFAVSDAGMLMPPKSTWFEPKLRSGLFIHKI